VQRVGSHRGELVECRPQGFSHEFEAVEHPDGRQHVGRIGALPPSGRESPQSATALQQRIEQERFGMVVQQSIPELTQHGKIEPRIT
jgi:hypothetical protein